MKTLFVLRHAKAERDSGTGKDFDRPLAKRGWHDAEAIGREMRARDLEPDMVVSSPAKRAAETVESLARGFGPLQPHYEPRIYDASVDQLIDVVRGADDGAQRMLLVGHNPGLESLILLLSGEGHRDYRSRIADGFPTAAIAAIELPVEQWRDVSPRSGRVVELILAKELD